MSDDTLKLTRRGALLAAAGAGLAVSACGETLEQLDPLPRREGPFKHGVASGDPKADSVVLWTAITPENGAGAGPVEVEMALDEAFSDIVWRAEAAPREGVLSVHGATPVKIIADGLEPGRWHYYRFRFGGETSPVGRTRTLPVGRVSEYRIAAFSCSNYPHGFFNAYRHAAEHAQADLMIHLGDYIYEYGMGGYGTGDAERLARVVDPQTELYTEEDYARRHSLYSLDPDLQAAKAAAAWLPIWDDHETANDSWVDGAENHDPKTEGDWHERRDAAIRAYHDWLPVREGETLIKRYGKAEIGDLATLVFLETRLTARSEELDFSSFPIDVGADPDDPANQAAVRHWRENIIGNPERRLISETQGEFVQDALAASVAEGKPWRVIANQVLMGRLEAPNFMTETPFWLRLGMRLRSRFQWEFAQRTAHGVPLNLDSWDGFPVDRERFYDRARAAGADFIVLTGDTHNIWTNDLYDASGERRGTEFGVTSVTSPSPYEAVNAPDVDFGRMMEERNPEILHNNVRDKGYLRLTLRRGEALAEHVRVTTIKSRDASGEVESLWRVSPSLGGAVPPVERIG
ncbi:alkaline phosphatase [Alkalicaulis satelles]|uniref:Alkaline phosphatase n=1 Tax=Alkalicaulis satelles TaxID=2609175 RepID=A0A5M6ZG19_9PROT|nr:alkaline phosphatase D family protein [Alkalicaulis satelles]KAA5803683.1 alkaline phosphatase [Alkalicaulis satelles]